MIGFTITYDDVKARLAITDRIISIGADMENKLLDASDLVYAYTRVKFDTWGAGQWPFLADATIQRKAREGYLQPERPLYATGDLYESATSPVGRYSERIIEPNRVVMLINWEERGYQIPTVLSDGDSHIPARPIWPSVDDVFGAQMMNDIRAIIHGP